MQDTDSDAFPRPFVTVDLAIFAMGEDGLTVLLTRRAAPPFVDAWSLPGGFVHADGDAGLLATATRVLRDKTGVTTPYLEQVETFGGASRDPRGWSVSVVYMVLLRADEVAARAGTNTSDVAWFPIAGQGVDESLAFDHADLLAAAVSRLRSKVEYSTIPTHLLPAAFTLSELQLTYERLLGRPLEKSAFRKRMAEADFVEPIAGEVRRGSNRPAQLYRLRRPGLTKLMDRVI